jgi:hypothetical protein
MREILVPSRIVSHVMTRPDAACASRVIVAHFEVSDVSTIRATFDALAITQLMFDLVLGTVQGAALRSARACARPAGLDDACAQIAFWQLRDGRR